MGPNPIKDLTTPIKSDLSCAVCGADLAGRGQIEKGAVRSIAQNLAAGILHGRRRRRDCSF
jgi:hypothetical protein